MIWTLLQRATNCHGESSQRGSPSVSEFICACGEDNSQTARLTKSAFKAPFGDFPKGAWETFCSLTGRSWWRIVSLQWVKHHEILAWVNIDLLKKWFSFTLGVRRKQMCFFHFLAHTVLIYSDYCCTYVAVRGTLSMVLSYHRRKWPLWVTVCRGSLGSTELPVFQYL